MRKNIYKDKQKYHEFGCSKAEMVGILFAFHYETLLVWKIDTHKKAAIERKEIYLNDYFGSALKITPVYICLTELNWLFSFVFPVQEGKQFNINSNKCCCVFPGCWLNITNVCLVETLYNVPFVSK